ncbi:MAG: hypothetical protein ACT4NY_19390 [Pseudonocardiales bacterium]
MIKAVKSAESVGGRTRDAIAVVVRRRGGERARTFQPWWPPGAGDDVSAVDLLTRIRPGPGMDVLSAGLVSDLERDEEMLRELTEPALLRAELIRLVQRHGGTSEAGKALYLLGQAERSVSLDRAERSVTGSRIAPVPAALVARFLSQEAR